MLPFESVKRKVIVKIDAVSDPAFGCVPGSRSVDVLLDFGVINLNKPAGPSSHQVSDLVKGVVGCSRAGHSGTLDPGVTGVLPVALGRGTRVTEALLTAGKEYVGIMRIHREKSEESVRKVIAGFVGKIMQLPPVRSAVVRRLRERSVYYFDVLDIVGRDVLFRTGVQAGTYIRKLVHDIGLRLGCGAHMVQLVRTQAGPFLFDGMVSLQDVEDAVWYLKNEGKEALLRKCVLPLERAVGHLSKVWVQDSAVDSICHGAVLNVPGVVRFEAPLVNGELVAVLSLKGELVALGRAELSDKELEKAVKGLAVRTEKVFMLPGTYPKFKREVKEETV